MRVVETDKAFVFFIVPGIVVGQFKLGNRQNNHGNLRTQHWDDVTGTHDNELGKY